MERQIRTVLSPSFERTVLAAPATRRRCLGSSTGMNGTTRVTSCNPRRAKYAARKSGLTAVPVIQGSVAVVTMATFLSGSLIYRGLRVDVAVCVEISDFLPLEPPPTMENCSFSPSLDFGDVESVSIISLFVSPTPPTPPLFVNLDFNVSNASEDAFRNNLLVFCNVTFPNFSRNNSASISPVSC